MNCHIDTTCTYPAGQCSGACGANFTTRRVRAGAPVAAPVAFVKALPRTNEQPPAPTTPDDTTSADRAFHRAVLAAVALVAVGLVLSIT